MLSALQDAILEFRIRYLLNGQMNPAKWAKFSALVKHRGERHLKRMHKLKGLL